MESLVDAFGVSLLERRSTKFGAFGVGPYVQGSLALIPADVSAAFLTIQQPYFTTQPRFLVITQAAGTGTTQLAQRNRTG